MPLLIIPTILGELYIINLNLEKIIKNEKLEGCFFELETNNFIISIRNLNNLNFKSQKFNPFEIKLISSNSNGNLALYEIPVECLGEFYDKPICKFTPSFEFKIQTDIPFTNYLPFFNKKFSQESCLTINYISNNILACINYNFVLKVINILKKVVVCQIKLWKFENQYSNINKNEKIDVKINSLPINPLKPNDDKTINVLICASILDCNMKNSFKILNLKINTEKNNQLNKKYIDNLNDAKYNFLFLHVHII